MINPENKQEVLYMVKEGISGFCMALADSVPGVSGGTVAFIMGFYDQFIGSIHDFVYGRVSKKKTAFRYLIKLAEGWMIGMVLAVLVLSALFESHSYIVSSLFIGFIAGSIPLIIREENHSFRQIREGILFGAIGILLVVGMQKHTVRRRIFFSKEQLFEKIWGYDYVGDSATVMVHINRIREKIEDNSRKPEILETVWGAGYRLNK